MCDELEKIVIDHKSPYFTGHVVVDNPDATWPELMLEYANLLNRAGYIIPIDTLEKNLYNSIVPGRQMLL